MTEQTPFAAPALPHNLDAEQELLGAIFLNNAVIPKVRGFLRPEDFYHAAHREIYRGILALADAGDTANPVTLSVYFTDDPVIRSAGGNAYLARLAASCTTVINAVEYAEAVADSSLRRRLMVAGDTLRMRAGSPQIHDPGAQILADHQRDLAVMYGETRQSEVTNLDVTARIVQALQHPKPAHSTGLPQLDHSMGGGLYPGRMYMIQARKKVGKTTILASISYNLVQARVKHQFFACEASPEEVQQSMIARYGGFNRMAFLPDGRDKSWVLTHAAAYARHTGPHLIWHETPGIAFERLQAQSLAGIAAGVKGTIVDYLQIVGGKATRDTEEYHTRMVAQWCADTARKTGTWFLLAAQVNQDGNTRGGEGAKLAADQVYQLHREKTQPGAWLEMEETRYTRYRNVGDDIVPGLYMSSKVGPYFMAPADWDATHDVPDED